MLAIELTAEQRNIVLEQIRRKTGKPAYCSYCSGHNIEVMPHFFRLELDGLIGVGNPLVAVACQTCTHVDLFFAYGLGIIDA